MGRSQRFVGYALKAASLVVLLPAFALPIIPSVAGENDACNIKGNVNTRGERIYHVPGQEYYEETRIVANHGERWFCSEEEARAAGWRKSKV